MNRFILVILQSLLQSPKCNWTDIQWRAYLYICTPQSEIKVAHHSGYCFSQQSDSYIRLGDQLFDFFILKICTVHAPLYAAACILFTPFWKTIFLFSRMFFSENCVFMYGYYSRAVSNQEWVIMAHKWYVLYSPKRCPTPVSLLIILVCMMIT